jgi:hypothetical protein
MPFFKNPSKTSDKRIVDFTNKSNSNVAELISLLKLMKNPRATFVADHLEQLEAEYKNSKIFMANVDAFSTLIKEAQTLSSNLSTFEKERPDSKLHFQMVAMIIIEAANYTSLIMKEEAFALRSDYVKDAKIITNILTAANTLMTAPSTKNINATLNSLDKLYKYQANHKSAFAKLGYQVVSGALLITALVLKLVKAEKTSERVALKSFEIFVNGFFPKLTDFKYDHKHHVDNYALVRELKKHVPKNGTKQAILFDKLLTDGSAEHGVKSSVSPKPR